MKKPHNNISGSRAFDWSYLLLVPFLVIGLVPWVKHRIPFRFVLVLPFVWLLMNFRSLKARLLPKRAEMLFYKWCGCLFVIFLIDLIFSTFHGELDIPDTSRTVDFFMIFLVLCIYHIAVNNGRIKELKVIIITCLVSLVIAALFSIRGLDDFEGGARLLTAASHVDADLLEISRARSVGIGSYGTIYGFGLLVIPLIMLIRFVKFNVKIFLAFILVLMFVTALKAGFTILIVVMVFAAGSMVLSLFVRGYIYHAIMLVSLATIVIVIINPSILKFTTPLLDQLSTLTTDPNYKFRLQSILDAIYGDYESYAVTRPELYWNSWEVFKTAPLTGYKGFSNPAVFSNMPGGHSSFFDILAYYGLLGAFFYVVFFVCHYKYIKIVLRQHGYEYFGGIIISFYYTLLLLTGINPMWGYAILSDLFLIIPGLFFFASPKFKEKNMPIVNADFRY